MTTAHIILSSLPSPPWLESQKVGISTVSSSSSSSSSSSPVSSRLPLCCLRSNPGACRISRASSPCLVVASSCSSSEICERFRARGRRRRIVEAKSEEVEEEEEEEKEVSPVCDSLVVGGGFVAAAVAAVLSRTVVLAAIISEALLRAARSLGETLTATKLPEARTLEDRTLVAALKGRLMVSAVAVTTAGVPLFFAAISQPGSVNTPLTVVASGMAKWLELYSGVLMVRVLLSWFPNIPWERQPLQAIRDMCDPYLNLFRNIIPPLFNALDLSPMLAFMVLGILTSILNTTVQG